MSPAGGRRMSSCLPHGNLAVRTRLHRRNVAGARGFRSAASLSRTQPVSPADCWPSAKIPRPWRGHRRRNFAAPTAYDYPGTFAEPSLRKPRYSARTTRRHRTRALAARSRGVGRFRAIGLSVSTTNFIPILYPTHLISAALRAPEMSCSSQTAPCITLMERAHNPEVAGSNPAPATRKAPERGLLVGRC